MRGSERRVNFSKHSSAMEFRKFFCEGTVDSKNRRHCMLCGYFVLPALSSVPSNYLLLPVSQKRYQAPGRRPLVDATDKHPYQGVTLPERIDMNCIVAMYWDNIDRRVVDAQRRVFEHFGYAIDQQERTGASHGAFLDDYMARLGEDDVALLMDIDCFPLNCEIVDEAFAAARDGRIFGCAQSSNHIDPDRLFAAPMFMAISRRTWHSLGRPSFCTDSQNDVAQRLNDIAAAAGVPIDMLFPWACIVPKWRLGDIALYGIGTFYKGGVFHLFEARRTPYSFILYDVADAVLNGREIDHLALVRKALPLYKHERWARRLTRWRKATWFHRMLKRLRGVSPYAEPIPPICG